MLKTNDIKFNEYWKIFYNYVSSRNIIFSAKKPFKKIKLIKYQSENIPFKYYNYVTKYEYTNMNTINIIINKESTYDYRVCNHFIELINKDVLKEYNINDIKFSYFSVRKEDDKIKNYYLLGLNNYNIFLLKYYYSGDYYEYYNLLELINKKEFTINFEEFYFKNIC
jgi:hypothetical protein